MNTIRQEMINDQYQMLREADGGAFDPSELMLLTGWGECKTENVISVALDFGLIELLFDDVYMVVLNANKILNKIANPQQEEQTFEIHPMWNGMTGEEILNSLFIQS